MSFAELYASPLQHPGLLWFGALLGLVLALARRALSRQVQWFCIALTVVSLLDAWLTANHILGFDATASAPRWVPLTFVLLGDFRYFFFVESARPAGTLVITKRGLLRACAWTAVVPIGSQVVIYALGSDQPRVLYLVYELSFVVLLCAFLFRYLPRRAQAMHWTRLVTLFGVFYYGLWALADAVILSTGADEGFLLRIVPNLLYYGGFVPIVAWTAPESPRLGRP